CPRSRGAWAVGKGRGTMLRRSAFGLMAVAGVLLAGSVWSVPAFAAGWAEQQSGIGNHLLRVSCPQAGGCVAVGVGGAVVRTFDGGETAWSTDQSGTPTDLLDVSCP